MKKNRSKQSKKRFHDLLLPVIFVLCLMPFVVYLAEFDYGYSKYLWHSDNSMMQDFYVYYRSAFFFVVLFFVLVILAFQFAIDKAYFKRDKIFYPLIAYLAFALLSAICSINRKAAFLGNLSEQGFFVLAGYVLIAYYTYQTIREEGDYTSIFHAILVMFVPLSLIGWLQVFKKDPLGWDWVQHLLMPDELYEMYGGTVEDIFTGNNVFLTLYNPNYAAIFLVMFACVFFLFFLTAQEKKEKVIAAVFLLDTLILCWFTYTRAALVAIVVAAILFVVMMGRKGEKKVLLTAFAAGAGLLVLLFVADAVFFQGKFKARILDEPKTTKLEAITTTEDGVSITYDGETYLLTMDVLKDGEVKLPFSGDCYAASVTLDDGTEILVKLDDMTLQFVKEDDGYYYRTDWGKNDRMGEVAAADFQGYEYLGSGRLYIWSRVLPMLKHYLFVGSGPDTFAEAYPQNDYVGKLIYAENAGRIIEGAHNSYLMCWVQTGLLSLVSFLIFAVWFLKRGFGYYRNCELKTVKERLGFGCYLGCVGYLVCGFFSDYTLYTTPVFFLFAGIALAASSRTENP